MNNEIEFTLKRSIENIELSCEITKLGENFMNIEQEIQQKGLVAPRITPQDIEANISSEFYFTTSDGAEWCHATVSDCNAARDTKSLSLLTICVLVLQNGFTVTGESACASPENFDKEVGRKVARQNAVSKIWPLMGYALRSKLHDQLS